MEPILLSPITLFQNAGFVGRSVMIVLATASIWSWILVIEALFAVRRLRAGLTPETEASGAFAAVFSVGAEASRRRLRRETTAERRQRIAEAMNREASDVLARAEGRLADLAVVASVSPFVGLFGTVWGIMLSFSGIAAAHDTSLAVVAPGIAEALAATAWGLAAAIPASVGYTRLGAAFGAIAATIGNRIEALAVDLVEAEDEAETAP